MGLRRRFVTDSFPDEVAGLRRTHVASILIVLIDGDAVGVADRMNALHEECSKRGIAGAD